MLLPFHLLLAAVEATLSHTTISETDTVQLTIRSSSGQAPSVPDLTVLEQDFDVGAPATRSEYSNINGRITSNASWSVTLRPKRSGTLTVPSLDVGGEKTAPLQLDVRALSNETRSALAAQLFFETTVEPRDPYVQAQVRVTRKLFYASGTQLYGELPEAPEVPDAVVIAVGETRSYTATHDNRTYGVLEQNFAVFPERSGELSIPEVLVTASTVLPGHRRRTAVRVRSDAVTLEVRGIPAGYPSNKPWFPARDVQLRQTWDPQLTPLSVGETRTRTLTVVAEGAVASLIPPLVQQWPGTFKHYPEPESIDDAAHQGMLVGTRIESEAIIPAGGGDVTIPEVSVTWWDTDDEVIKTARLDAVAIRVGGSSLTPAAPPVVAATPAQVKSAPDEGNTAAPREAPWPTGWIIATMLGWGAACLAAFLWWRERRADQHRPVEQGQAAIARPQPASLVAKQLSGSEPAAAKRIIAQWLASHWRTTQANALARFADTPAGAAQLAAINSQLYASSDGAQARGEAGFDPDALLAAARDCLKQRASTEDALPGLYPA